MEKNWIGKARHAPLLVVLIAAVTVFGILPAHAGKSQPAPPPPPPSTTDTDSDGLIDTQENNGITFSSGVTGTTSYQRCSGSETGPARNLCLNVNGKEVFVFIKKDPDNPSLLPLTNSQVDLDILLEPVYRTGSTGLAVAIHRLIPTSSSSWSPTNRNIPGDTRTNPQKAIFITESLDPTNPETLGSSGVGTPNYGGGDITIFTRRIYDQVSSVCTAGITCTDMNNAQGINAVVTNWLIHVASHEVAHSLSLRSPLDPTWREHYPTATRRQDPHTILEQGMYKEYPTSSTVKFFISKDFTSNEQGNWQFYIP